MKNSTEEAGTSRDLRAMQAAYLESRGHVLSIDGLPFEKALEAQGKYVLGEALELHGAVFEVLSASGDEQQDAANEHLRHEIADVVLAVVTLANVAGWFVEDCIGMKTEKDRDRDRKSAGVPPFPLGAGLVGE